jgi:catechol 2,3-dioxygenase-like lactoylglutathione lyase family enzyme
MQKRLATRLPISGSFFAVVLLLILATSGWLFAQVQPTNDSGISVNSIHLIVQNPDEHKKLWMDLFGAEAVHNGSMELLKIPGLFVIFEKGEPVGPSAGSSVNHVGVWINDYDRAKAKVTAAHLAISGDNYKAVECAAAPGTQACQMTVTFPDGYRIEFTEDKKLSSTSAGHHIHMMATDPESIRDWYAKNLAATPYLRRGTIVAAKFTNGEVDFNKANEAPAPSKGRAIDHFGLDMKGLEAFCKKLEAAGVKLDTPVHSLPGTSIKSAFITDPVGGRIELTEGLAAAH